MEDKDYCDKDTAFALQELGYNPYMFYDDGVPAIHLWHAQKWLREEKNIIVEVTFSPFGHFASIYTNVRTNEQEHLKDAFRLIWDNKIYPEEEYEEYESTLLMGIKEAVKILKEE